MPSSSLSTFRSIPAPERLNINTHIIRYYYCLLDLTEPNPRKLTALRRLDAMAKGISNFFVANACELLGVLDRQTCLDAGAVLPQDVQTTQVTSTDTRCSLPSCHKPFELPSSHCPNLHHDTTALRFELGPTKLMPHRRRRRRARRRRRSCSPRSPTPPRASWRTARA